MDKQITVYVLIGQRGAGKSTYAEKLIAQQPALKYVSRDAILMAEFGRIDCDHYSGNLEYGEEETWRVVKEVCMVESETSLILDYWSWTSQDRRAVIKRLRELGATSVTALYFKTPLDLVNQWFWLKPKIAKASEMKRIGFKRGFTFYLEDAPEMDYRHLHRQAETIASDGFDKVIEVDPTVALITL